MARKENGGGGEADSTNPNADREEETDTLLGNVQGRAASSDVVDGRRAEVAEEQPLINESAGSRKQNDVLATPSSSRRDSCTAKSDKHTKSVRSSLVPVLVTLDPTDRVSLNTGKYLSFVTNQTFVYVTHYL